MVGHGDLPANRPRPQLVAVHVTSRLIYQPWLGLPRSMVAPCYQELSTDLIPRDRGGPRVPIVLPTHKDISIVIFLSDIVYELPQYPRSIGGPSAIHMVGALGKKAKTRQRRWWAKATASLVAPTRRPEDGARGPLRGQIADHDPVSDCERSIAWRARRLT